MAAGCPRAPPAEGQQGLGRVCACLVFDGGGGKAVTSKAAWRDCSHSGPGGMPCPAQPHPPPLPRACTLGLAGRLFRLKQEQLELQAGALRAEEAAARAARQLRPQA